MKLRHGICVILALFYLTGCGTTDTAGKHRDPDGTGSPQRLQLDKAKQLEEHGDFVSATKIYFDLAKQAPNQSRRLDYDLSAISTLLRGGYIPQARRFLELLPRRGMNKQQALRYRLQLARIYMIDGKPSIALKTLGVKIDPKTSITLLKEIHDFRAKAHKKQGNLLKAVQEYVLVQELETNAETQKENNKLVWETLQALTIEQMQKRPPQPPPDTLSGWLELAYLSKTLSHNKAQLDVAMAKWHKSYPQHPAANSIEDLFKNVKDFTALNNIEQIGLILPLSGRFGKAARAVRDGFFAAYYAHKIAKKPSVRIYDVGKKGSQLIKLYQQATDSGAQLVIGPLDKEGVNQLADNPTVLTVPTLALNYTEKDTGELPNLFQFGLASEDEARQVAERAWLNGYKRAVAIVPRGKWGERVLSAFTDYYQQVDGILLEDQFYDPGKSDYSLPLRRLLNIDDSELRFVDVKRVVNKRIEFTPRRRQDIDFIFMLAFPRQARLLQPQLKFHYAADIPIFATSHVYEGKPNRNADRDMDGISFCDIPWILQPELARELQSTLSRNTGDFNRYRRFYALGIDAYQLIAKTNLPTGPEISRLANDEYERYNGQTGDLSMDATRRIRRNLSWAIFKRGLPKAIESAPEQIPAQKEASVQQQPTQNRTTPPVSRRPNPGYR